MATEAVDTCASDPDWYTDTFGPGTRYYCDSIFVSCTDRQAPPDDIKNTFDSTNSTNSTNGTPYLPTAAESCCKCRKECCGKCKDASSFDMIGICPTVPTILPPSPAPAPSPVGETCYCNRRRVAKTTGGYKGGGGSTGNKSNNKGGGGGSTGTKNKSKGGGYYVGGVYYPRSYYGYYNTNSGYVTGCVVDCGTCCQEVRSANAQESLAWLAVLLVLLVPICFWGYKKNSKPPPIEEEEVVVGTPSAPPNQGIEMNASPVVATAVPVPSGADVYVSGTTVPNPPPTAPEPDVWFPGTTVPNPPATAPEAEVYVPGTVEATAVQLVPDQITSVADELKKLASLRDKGVLNDEEFEAAKDKVLKDS